MKKIIPIVGKYAALVSRELGHWYGNGVAYGKNIVALSLGSVFRCSDRELPDELDDRRLLRLLGYQNPPDHSIFSKVRKEVGEEKIGKVAETIIHEIYRDKLVSMVAIDSTFVPYYFDNDEDAKWGYVTLKRKEQEILREKTQKGIKKGYKLHVIYDVETGIPLYWVVLPANVNDKKYSRNSSTT
ncbi:MAG: transposase [Candidatus Micrarchaeota archaeon]|nr:transposase [Candidatus Micrarchaeota archaeon]MDE1847890.1 transposase [Candidatus Micrarchaeota archaeon]MDE1864516.1 transposase [Candidatus Micrarchaeota archaeon]